ncbi:YibE/F family protein [Serinibacter arcticus]|uniref:YibE/F family protein n=1 Tax=Serinibacter arcticus TaxID=1655435 RepID=A0A2U1ZR81_9MICO|nr:YibE/F family protein [Serinibacter arcticus]PWD49504.1 YibE/F family protein [Serinibacter arcticus]
MTTHEHGHGPVHLPAGEVRRARLLLTAIVVPLLLATIVGLALLWPKGDSLAGSIPMTAPGVSFEEARILAVPGTEGAEVTAELLTGEGAGLEVAVGVPPDVLAEPIPVGARIVVLFQPGGLESGAAFTFIDYQRQIPLIWLAVAYVALVAVVARWRGLAAVVGLAVSLGVIGLFVLPALMSGTNPLLVAIVGSSAMMFVSLYLAHGVSIRTTTALLGTFVGLAVTAVLAIVSASGAHLLGTGSEEGYQVMTTFPEMSMRALLVCGFVIAGLGALNDVTITQASAVWELHASDPTVPRRRVFLRAMRIGRDHIASTVYTLAFAYVGTALPMLMIASVYDRSPVQLITSATIAEELVRTLVSSIGLVLAIPVTTAIAAVLVRTSRRDERQHVVVAAGPATAAVPVAQGPTPAVGPDPAPVPDQTPAPDPTPAVDPDGPPRRDRRSLRSGTMEE